MEIIDCIMTRRSIRKYRQKEIPDAKLRTMLECAMMAPSAGNSQPWQFVVIRDKEILRKLATIHPYATMAGQAGLAILVCGDESKERFSGFFPQDCAAASQNILLSAHGLGLGAVWAGIYPENGRVMAFQEEFHLPKGIIPFSLILVGFPDETKDSQNRFDPGRVHLDSWEG